MSFNSRIASMLLAAAAVIAPAAARDITAGVAITDSVAMQELEAQGFALSTLFSPTWQRGAASPVLDNTRLADLPAFRTMRSNVRAELALYNDGYIRRFKEAGTAGVFGVGTRPNHRMFERNWLGSSAARFDLVGIVNRMDRAYHKPETCGEIRFIYRLAYKVMAYDVEPYMTVVDGRQVESVRRTSTKIATESRLPMTINLVLRARNAPAAGVAPAVTCQELAKRWIAAGDGGKTGKELARQLMAGAGALALVDPSQIDRIETNIQVTRIPATVISNFGGNAEYLLHIFKWDPVSRGFTRAKLENQIDRDLLLRSPEKLAAFKAWLFQPEQLHRLVEGTIEIPDDYLATRAITSAPGGTARATNRPFLGLISRAEVEQFLAKHGEAARQLDPEKRLRSVLSPLGLEQRLTDVTCSGCHQSRAIGGFHFLGSDWSSSIAKLPQNSIFVAGSPHFFADLPRRRAVIDEIASGKSLSDVDFGRGFSMRPRRTGRGGKIIYPAAFDGLRNGWGSNCVVEPPRGVKKDASFDDWTCNASKGLVCKALHESEHEPGFGVCIHGVRHAGVDRSDPRRLLDRMEAAGLKIGDPFLFGRLTSKDSATGAAASYATRLFRDDYCATEDILNGRRADPGRCLPVPGASKGPDFKGAAYQGGGFFAGMHKRKGCTNVPKGTAVCGNEAGRHFTACAVGLTANGTSSFVPCLTRPFASDKSTLRACNVLMPCRDDYVCLATTDTPKSKLGACLPPYFLFQFRLDGHPAPPEGPAPRLPSPI